MADGVDLRLLGPLELVVAGTPRSLGGLRQRAVLALLAIHANQVLSTDRIADEVWAGEPPARFLTTLQGYVFHLRKAIAGTPLRIETRAPGYALTADPEHLDTRRFERMVEDARAALTDDRPTVAHAHLTEALALWRGTALADFTYEPFAEAEIARLEELRFVAQELHAEAELAAGRTDAIVATLEVLVRENPLREAFRGQLMRALHAGGRSAEALRVYSQGREILAEELGIDPSPALQRLERAILLQDPALDARTPAPAPAISDNLPAATTSFVGRADELVAIGEQLRASRLVTLIGAGGSGKTRLALEAAAQAVRAHPDGAWLVELAPITDSAHVADAIAGALSLQEQPDKPLIDTLVETMRRRALLLVLDNCERVVDGVAPLVDTLLRACRQLRVLATSREALGVEGEHAWAVPTLPNTDAVRLFTERATAAQPGFAVDDTTASTITQICERLDGMPLAIELAAARLRMLTVPQIAERLDDRFRLLTSGSRTALPRHRTLAAAIDWSYESLPADEQSLFERLSVFAGSFTLEQVETVCPGEGIELVDILDLLTGLVNKSLVMRAGGDETARYQLLETLRAYASDRAAARGDQPRWRDRHAGAVSATAAEAAARMHRADWWSWVDRLDTDHDDCRAAIDWLLTKGAADDALELATALWPFWHQRYYVTEGRTWLRRAREAGGSPARQLPALIGAAALALMDDDLEATVTACADGLLLAHELGDAARRGQLLVWLSEAVRHENDPVRTMELGKEAIALLSAAGDLWHEAQATRVLTLVSWDHGDLNQTETLAARCVELFDTYGDVEGSAGARSMLAGIARDRGRYGAARELYEEARRLFADAREPWGSAQMVRMLGTLAWARGDYDEAWRLGAESLELHEEIGNERGIAESLKLMGDAALNRGDLDRAELLCSEALARFRSRGFAVDVTSALTSAARVALAHSDLQGAAALCDEALAPYRASGHKREAAPALALLGIVRARSGNPDRAAVLCDEALALFQETGDEGGAARALDGLAEAAVAAGEVERAARYLSAARSARERAGTAVLPVDRPDHERTVAAVVVGVAGTPFGDSWIDEWESRVIDLRASSEQPAP